MTSAISTRDKSTIKPGWMRSLGILFALLWLLITFLQEIEYIFVLIGFLNLILMISTRYIVQNKDALELEGGIMGFIVTWIFAFMIYLKKSTVIELFTFTSTVNDLLMFMLVLALLAWFIISPRKSSQDLIFNFPPFYSNFLLNQWKLAIMLLFVIPLLQELIFLKDYIIIYYYIVGWFELAIFYYYKQLKINYIDIILNPFSLLTTLLGGLTQMLKWILLTALFIVIGTVPSDIFSLGLIFAAIFIGIISIITSGAKLTLESGLIESRVKEGKTLVPQIIDEVQAYSSVEQLTSFNEFYQLKTDIKIKNNRKEITMKKDNVLIKMPFSNELNKKTGVFIFYLNLFQMLKNSKKNSKRRVRKTSQLIVVKGNDKVIKKNVEEFNLRGSNIHRLTYHQWDDLLPNLSQIHRKEFAQILGYKDMEEFDKRFSKLIQGTTFAQDQIRSRLRGTPSMKRDTKIYAIKVNKGIINIPDDLLKEMDINNNTELELIPGKHEYAFYIRRKK